MFTLRRYRASDHDIVKALHFLALNDIGAYGNEPHVDDDFDQIETVYLNGRGEFLVGEIDGEIVVMGALKKISDSTGEIKRMRVHPKYQRRGFGKAILDALETRAKELGYRTIQLDTTDKQVGAQQFYLDAGYSEFRKEYRFPYEIIFMRKNLI